MFDGDLAGDDGRGATVAIIEDEELNAAKGFEQAAIATVTTCEGERLEQARDAMILDRTIVAGSFVAEGTGNPALAEPGCPGDEQVLIAVDPVAACEPGENGAVDAARDAQIDIFHACALAQRGELEARRKTPGVTFGSFAIDEQSDALLERQGIEIRRSSL